MLYLLRKNKRLNIFISVLLPLIFIFSGNTPTYQNSSLIFQWAFDKTANRALDIILFLGVFYSLVFSLRYIQNFYRLNTSRNFFIFLITTLLYIGLVSIPQLTPALIGSLIMCFILYKIVNSFNHSGLSFHYLDIGLALVAGILIDFNMIYLSPIIFIGLILFRSANWREWFFPFAGIILVGMTVVGINYLLNIEDIFRTERISLLTTQQYPFIELSPKKVAFLIVLFFNILSGSVYVTQELMGKKIILRRLFILLLWLFLIGSGTYLIFKLPSSYLIFAIIPSAYLLTHYYTNCRLRWYNEIIFDLFVITSLINLF